MNRFTGKINLSCELISSFSVILLQVMVHFTAAWCVPSVAMNPFFEELALNYQDIMFLLVDVDDVKVLICFLSKFINDK